MYTAHCTGLSLISSESSFYLSLKVLHRKNCYHFAIYVLAHQAKNYKKSIVDHDVQSTDTVENSNVVWNCCKRSQYDLYEDTLQGHRFLSKTMLNNKNISAVYTLNLTADIISYNDGRELMYRDGDFGINYHRTF